MVDVTIREYMNRKCINTFANLRFPTMIYAEEFVNDFFDSYHGSCRIKATIEKSKDAPDDIDFDELTELLGHDEFVDELELEDVKEGDE